MPRCSALPPCARPSANRQPAGRPTAAAARPPKLFRASGRCLHLHLEHSWSCNGFLQKAGWQPRSRLLACDLRAMPRSVRITATCRHFFIVWPSKAMTCARSARCACGIAPRGGAQRGLGFEQSPRAPVSVGIPQPVPTAVDEFAVRRSRPELREQRKRGGCR